MIYRSITCFAALLMLSRVLAIDLPQTQLEEVGGRKLEHLLINTAHPRAVVIFENGARETLDKWDKVIAEVGKDATIFAYNRPGYGRSDKAQTPRDGRTIVEELRQALRQEGLKPPYLLVGHSMGGLYTQLYARAYPQEVQGVVLVDSLYPGIVKKPQDFPLYARVAKYLFLSDAVAREIDAIHDTGDEVLALPWHDGTPMVQLFNVPKSAGAVAVDFGAFNTDDKTRARVNAMYPTAKKIVVDSDHQIQVESPEVVIAAIHEVMAANVESHGG